jgi:TolA-binding protein
MPQAVPATATWIMLSLPPNGERNLMAKSTIDRITSEVMDRASQYPTANRVLQGAMQMKERVDDLSKRVRGLEAMEKQLAEIEKRLAKLEGGAKRAAGKPAGAEKPAAAEKPATKE